MRKKFWIGLIGLLFPVISYAQFYTGSQLEFGKNRVQHRPLNWFYYNYDKYQVYFYEGGNEIAKYVSKSAKKNIQEIERLFDYTLDTKLQFIVYNKQSDFMESNIGLASEEQYNTGGITRIAGAKVSLYFEGDHQELEQQLRAGIAEVLLNQMMYGGDMKDMLKSSTLLTLPDWYTKGLISYVSKGWNTELDNRVKDGIISGKYTKFNRLTGPDAVAAGHSIWHYIAETYGESVISNLLYMTKVSRNIESAFLFVLGVSVKNLSMEWLESYYKKYDEFDKTRSLPATTPVVKKPKPTRIYNQVKISPDGKHLVYVTNELGQYKVWLYDLETNKQERLMKEGHKIDRINDLSYPLIGWHPSGKYFNIIREKEGKVMLGTYVLDSKEYDERLMLNFEKVLDFSYHSDGKKFVMSGVQNGQSDIFVFTAASNAYEQITKDLYDDLQPRFVRNSREIAFVSNRPDDTIRFVSKNEIRIMPPTRDIFVYDYVTKSKVLRRLTDTPDINETDPEDYDSVYYAYISDQNGIRNRYLAMFDSVLAYVDTAEHYRYVVNSFPITNYSRNIIEHDVDPASGKIADVIYADGNYRIYITSLPALKDITPLKLRNTYYRDTQTRIKERKKREEEQAKEKKKKDEERKKRPGDTQHNPTEKDTTLSTTTSSGKKLQVVNVIKDEKDTKAKQDSSKIDIDNYTFENGRNKDKKSEVKESPPDTSHIANAQVVADTLKPAGDTLVKSKSQEDEDEFTWAKQRNYTINYFTDYVVSQLDNSYLNTTYQKFTGGGSPVYLNPGFTGLFKVGMSDLFEDYRIVGGMRLSGDLRNNEYFLSYENRIKRLDKQIVLHRQAMQTIYSGFTLVKVHTHDVKYILKWPFSEVASIQGTIMARNDRTVFLSTDLANLQKPHEYDTWGILKGEYIFDNTIKRGLNLYNGFRAKAFAEYYKQIDLAETDMVVLGFDARHYQKIHRDFIWANRIAGSTSLGKQKLIYYMGGVDNWFLPKFDRSINIATDQNYAYQTLATNMRGFYQNIRNGNSFMVINSELRMPLFRYLLNRPIRSDFVNNFQVIGFGDVGTAWTGASPYSEENSLNKTILGAPGNPITVILNSQKEPIVGGYGFGLRSRIWGYFVRVDWAWGVEDGVVLDRITYLSFSLDF